MGNFMVKQRINNGSLVADLYFKVKLIWEKYFNVVCFTRISGHAWSLWEDLLILNNSVGFAWSRYLQRIGTINYNEIK